MPADLTGVEVTGRPMARAEVWVIVGTSVGMLCIALGVFAMPWVVFENVASGTRHAGFNEVRQAFGDLSTVDRFLGSPWLWLSAAFYGLGYGVASLGDVRPRSEDENLKQYLPVLPLVLCGVFLWRIHHFMDAGRAEFLLSGLDVRFGFGGILTAFGCALVAGAVVFGHRIPAAWTGLTREPTGA